jgi:cell division protein FtsQ
VRLTRPRLLVGALLVVCLGALSQGLPLLRSLALFHVERVEVAGAQLLAPHEVLAASRVSAGQSVWDDPQPWIDALQAHPVIRAASVQRSLPGTLLIRIEERRPVALIEAGSLRPVTADGEVLPVDPARTPVDLPLVRATVAPADSYVRDPAVKRVLAELGRLAVLDPSLLVRVSEIGQPSAGELRLTLGHPVAELLLPEGAGADQLRQLRAVFDHLERRAADAQSPQRIVRVDARFADQVVVRFPPSS